MSTSKMSQKIRLSHIPSTSYYFTRSRAAKSGKTMKKKVHNTVNSDSSYELNPTDSNLHVPSVERDEQGHLVFKLGDVLDNRYKIIDILGKGGYAQVVHVKDLETTDKSMALKIGKNKDKVAAEKEISVLTTLGKIDPSSIHLCSKLLSTFNYHGHICLTFNKFGLSVFDFLKENNYHPYHVDEIRHVAYQLCYAVKFLHDNKITHTDIKPENVVFVNSDYDLIYDNKRKINVRRVKRTDIRLIDFGNATFDYGYHHKVVTTRNYRAPEVILELGWAQPCDVWSIACMLFEMYLGYMLFITRNTMEHLAMMERVLGEIPYRMTEDTETMYLWNGTIDLNDLSDHGLRVKRCCRPFINYKKQVDDDHNALFDLMQRMLQYEPSERIKLEEAMSHDFFSKIAEHRRFQY